MGKHRKRSTPATGRNCVRCLLTRDRNLEYQQNLAAFDLAVIVPVAPTNDIEDLRPLMKAANEVIESIRPTEVRYVGGLASQVS
jgi:hypothetical protein